ncbi:hypothetical protein ACN47E_003243 [Coniothyrium glycines]
MVSRNRQHHLDRDRERVASRISKDIWQFRVTRPSTFPRGIVNPGNFCYRNSALQPLLHLPRFLNWILQHAEDGQNWPCRPKDPDLSLPDDAAADYNGDNLTRLGDKATGCVACLLKQLVQWYWGPQEGDDDRMPKPKEIHYKDDAISHLHGLANRWYCEDPDTWTDQKQDMIKAAKEQVGTNANAIAQALEALQPRLVNLRKTLRLRNMSDQQDSDGYLQKLLSHCDPSWMVKRSDPHRKRRGDQFDALFTTQIRVTRHCEQEHELLPLGESAPILRLKPLHKGKDSVKAAFDRWAAPEDGMAMCTECNGSTTSAVDATLSKTIDAAPEYLIIKLDLEQMVEYTVVKIDTSIDIPDILDLTNYMTSSTKDPPSKPVRYKLRHVTYHIGGLKGGHYVAGVTGFQYTNDNGAAIPVTQYCCNDATHIGIWKIPGVNNAFTNSPARVSAANPMHRSTRLDANVLFYERIHSTTAEDESIADRVVRRNNTRSRTSKLGAGKSADAMKTRAAPLKTGAGQKKTTAAAKVRAPRKPVGVQKASGPAKKARKK